MKLREALNNYKAYFVDGFGKVIQAGDWHEEWVKKVQGIPDDKSIWAFIDKLLLKGWIKIRTTHAEASVEYVVGKPNNKAWSVALKEITTLKGIKAVSFAGFDPKNTDKIKQEDAFDSMEEFLNSKLAKRYFK
jgi:hypothetical protein